jgi:hypothetical protein|eukprot:SAG31_NODE_22127_length_533_cov_0.880184_2_plen_50_part_00
MNIIYEYNMLRFVRGRGELAHASGACGGRRDHLGGGGGGGRGGAAREAA